MENRGRCGVLGERPREWGECVMVGTMEQRGLWRGWAVGL